MTKGLLCIQRVWCVEYLDMCPVCCVIGVFVGAWFGMAWVGVVGLFRGFLGLLLVSCFRIQPVLEGHVALVPVRGDLLGFFCLRCSAFCACTGGSVYMCVVYYVLIYGFVVWFACSASFGYCW